MFVATGGEALLSGDQATPPRPGVVQLRQMMSRCSTLHPGENRPVTRTLPVGVC